MHKTSTSDGVRHLAEHLQDDLKSKYVLEHGKQ